MLRFFGKMAWFGGVGGAAIVAGAAIYDLRGQTWTGFDQIKSRTQLESDCKGALKTVFYGTNRSVQKIKKTKKGERYRVNHENAERLHVGSLEVCLPTELEDNSGRYNFAVADQITNDLGRNNSDRNNLITIATIEPFTHDNTPDTNKICAVRDELDGSTLEHNDFCAEVREEMEEKGDAVVLFVHGYNVRFDSAAARAAQLSANISFEGATMTYSWPSAASLLQYFRDGEEAEIAAFFLKEYIELIIEEITPERLHIIAHSMGNRALIGALEELSEELGGSPTNESPPVDSVILAAADIDQRLFRFADDDLVGIVDHVTIYAANDDRALDQSRFWHGFERLGQVVGKGERRRAYIYEQDENAEQPNATDQDNPSIVTSRKPSVYTIDASCDTFDENSSARKYCGSTNEATTNTDLLARAKELGTGVIAQIRKRVPSGDNHDIAFVVTPFINDITHVTRGIYAKEDRELEQARIDKGRLIYELPDKPMIDADKEVGDAAGGVDQMPEPAPEKSYYYGSEQRRSGAFGRNFADSSQAVREIQTLDAYVSGRVIKFKENAARVDREYFGAALRAAETFLDRTSCQPPSENEKSDTQFMRIQIIFDTSGDASATARLAMIRRDALVTFMTQNGVPASLIEASLIGRTISPTDWKVGDRTVVLDEQGWAEVSFYCK